jgi:hypothetical protein
MSESELDSAPSDLVLPAQVEFPVLTRQAARVHKFNASRTRYGDTIYHSKKEANYAARLDMLKKATDPKDRVAYWTRQIRVPLVVKSILIANWYIDFLVHFADGREEYHEVKGFATETYRLKRKLFGALYPNRVLKVIR